MKSGAAAVTHQTLNPLTRVPSKSAKVIPVYQWNGFDKIKAIKEGVTKEQLENLKAGAELDYDTLARVLNVAKATLHNKKGKAKFDQYISERIFLVADLYSFGYEVFGSRQKFNSWMKSEIRALGYVTPLSLIDTLYGIEEVKNIIGRIAYGIIS